MKWSSATLAVGILGTLYPAQCIDYPTVQSTPNLRRKEAPYQALPTAAKDFDDVVVSTRQLQQTFNFRANYTVLYQVLQDTLCEGPPPVIRVNCRGRNIQITNTSDPSIVCATSPRVDENGWSYLKCNNTCASETECLDVYLQKDQPSQDGNFGRIDFTCAGDELSDVDAGIIFEDSGDGLCGASSSSLTRNLHIARMGVSCPNDVGNSSEYVFDDYYFECVPALASYPFGDNLYTCLTGASCDGLACNVDFETLIVSTDTKNFVDRCVEKLVPVTLAPTPAPAPTSANLTFSSRFEAGWSLMFDPLSGTACSGYTPTVQIECIKGNIQFVSSIYDSMNCTKVGPSNLTCTDTGSANVIDQFTSMVYECSGPVLPQTVVGFDENVAFCEGNTVEGTVTHSLQLGMFCRQAAEEFLFSGDLFFDCVGVSPHFSFLDEFGSSDSVNATRYTCSEGVTFATGSTANQTQTIPYFAMSTDSNWVNTPDSACYTLDRAGSPSAPTGSVPTPLPPTEAPVAVTSLPTMSPTQVETTTLAPIRNPTVSPTAKLSPPTMAPATSLAPIVSPIASPTVPAVVASPAPQNVPVRDISSNSDSGAPIGAIVGGAVAGVVVIIVAGLVGFFVAKSRPKDNRANFNHHVPAPDFKVTSAYGPTGGSSGQHPAAPRTTQAEVHHSMEASDYKSDSDENVSKQQEESYADSNSRSGAASHSASPYDQSTQYSSSANATQSPGYASAAGYASATRPVPARPARPVEFKDQARSVLYDVPMVNVQPVQAVAVTAVPVSPHPMDTSVLSTGTTRREPSGRHMDL